MYKKNYCKSFEYRRNALDKIRDMLGQVDESTTLGYIYNPNTEQENLDIMNKALNRSNKKSQKN
ncbi:hypothetical protein acsn021_34100 [Anaerocolumna cellulosilytica]|uniref:Uncharacterized protein n=1 Tax=Anaerocolumna cellulosilytica TaxID=433286 RepID=A0A6S6RAG1_9FIRM|nr:hypothetical protein acsn021_34100 [Anaerocolumna cellulosilytica]